MTLGPVTPIPRCFDEAKTREFSLGFLGFTLDWEHRFEPNAPLYMGVSRDGCALHLSERHSDCSPGAAIRIVCGDIDAYRAKPGIESSPWGGREFPVKGPFGNRLTFASDT